MNIPINAHANQQHTQRELIDDVQRMMDADNYTRATCSFPKRQWRDTLAQEVMNLESTVYDLWKNDKYGQRRISISHTFDEDDAQRLRVPTRYVGVYADDNGTLRFATTRTISIVLDKTRDGIELYNAFPNMSASNRTDIQNIDMLPYVQQTQRWKTANLSRRMYYRAKCGNGVGCAISWDEMTSQMVVPIAENGQELGRVLIGMASQIWEVDGDSAPMVNDRWTHSRLLKRAFPETWAIIEKIEQLRDDEMQEQELTSSYMGAAPLPDLVGMYCTEPMPETKPAQEDNAPEQRPQKKPGKGKARAMRRSKAAQRNMAKKSTAKRSKRPKSQSQRTSPTTPFQFKRVMTKFEEFGLSQNEQNSSIIMLALGRYAILANDIEEECLLPGPMFKRIMDDMGNALVWMPLPMETALHAVHEIDDERKNTISEESQSKSLSAYLDANTLDVVKDAIANNDVRARPTKDSAVITLLEQIAEDPHWHIVLPDKEAKLLEEDGHDILGRKLTRIPDENAKHIVAKDTFGKNYARKPKETAEPQNDDKQEQTERIGTKKTIDLTEMGIRRGFSATHVIKSYLD